MSVFTGSIPNFFIGVRTNKDVCHSVSRYIKFLEKAFKHFEDKNEFMQAVEQPVKYHVALCVCTLDSDDDIERVKQVRAFLFEIY